MMRRTVIRSLVLAAAVASLAWTPGAKGPPWISIEYPPNPHDATTRGAFLLVHAFHHGTPMSFPVRGTAEGVVEGQRRSVDLSFDRTSRAGVYALRKQWPTEGVWMLAITVTQGASGGATATALVDIGAAGEVAAVRVPTTRQDEWNIPSKVTAQEIDAALRARVAFAARGR
jgi:hypothetical protein